MAEQPCLPQVQACVMRLARLEPNGVPDPGADNLYVTDALVTLTFTPVYTDGDEIEVKNACGNVGVNYRGSDSFKRGDVAIDVLTPDPFLAEFLSGGDVLTDGARKGYAAPPIGPVTGNGISVELWSLRVDDGDLDPDSPYAWWAYPKVKNLRLGGHTHNNGAILPRFTGQAYENVNWFDGPLNDWPADSDRVYQWIPTATKPTPSCSYATIAVS